MSLRTPGLCATDSGTRPQDPQRCFTATRAIVSCQPHLNSTYHQCLYQAETQPKNCVEKENSAIGVNYPGRKSIPTQLLTRGEIIKTKGTEGSADQRSPRCSSDFACSLTLPHWKVQTEAPDPPAPRDTSGVSYSHGISLDLCLLFAVQNIFL